MLAAEPPITLALARGPLAAADPATAEASNPVAQISATPILTVRDSITTLIGGAALALEPERSRDRVRRPRRRVCRRVGDVQLELARGPLHQPEQRPLHGDPQAEGLGGGESAGVGDRHPAAQALEDGGSGHRAVDRADRERLEPLLDLDLAGREGVD